MEVSNDSLYNVRKDAGTIALPEVTVAGANSGVVTIGDIKHTNGLIVKDTNYKIISFECTDISDDIYKRIFKKKNTGSDFTDELLRLIKGIDVSADLRFENIIARNNDSDTVILNPLIIHVQ